MKILYVSSFLNPNSFGGPSLRAKNSLAVLGALGEIQKFDLETVCRFNWTGGSSDVLRNYSGNKLLGFLKHFIHSRISRALQILEITTELVSLSGYQKLRCIISESSPDLVWFSYATDYSKLFLKLRKEFPAIPFVADTQAVLSTHLRKASTEIPGTRGLMYRGLAKIKRRQENLIIERSSVTTAVSEVDQEEYLSRGVQGKVEIFPNVVAVRDWSKIKMSTQKTQWPSILLTGTFGGKEGAMTHGALWFLEKVLPLVMREIPSVSVSLVGKQAYRIRDFIKLPSNVDVQSDVQSLDPYFRSAWCSICPIFFESGTRFKILEASEWGLPTVSTSLGAEGLDFSNGKEILIADTAEMFAAQIVGILNNSKLREQLGYQSRKKVNEEYSLEAGQFAAKRIIQDCVT